VRNCVILKIEEIILGIFYPLYFKQLLGIPVAIVVIEVGGMNAYPCKNQDKGM